MQDWWSIRLRSCIASAFRNKYHSGDSPGLSWLWRVYNEVHIDYLVLSAVKPERYHLIVAVEYSLLSEVSYLINITKGPDFFNLPNSACQISLIWSPAGSLGFWRYQIFTNSSWEEVFVLPSIPRTISASEYCSIVADSSEEVVG